MKSSRLATFALSVLPPVCLAQEIPAKHPENNPLPDRPIPATRPAAVPQPPRYSRTRWEEDYSYLTNPEYRTDYLDPIKYVPIGEDGSYASVGGHARYRYEYFNNNDFGVGPQDEDGYHLSRFFLHADFHLTPYFRAFVEGKSAMEDGREGGPRGSDADEADVQQLFADFILPLEVERSLTIRLGRQDLLYGVQRLVGPGDWGNTRRTFEGGKFVFRSPGDTFEAFWVRPVVNENEEPNPGNGNVSFAGVYNTTRFRTLLGPAANTRVETYFFALNESPASQPHADQDTYTVGSRFASAPRPWDIDVEGNYQFGDSGPGEISAWSFDTEVGYTFPVTHAPRPFVGFDVTSGDRDPSDPDRQTFNQLFALGHASYGFADTIGKQNAIDLHPGMEVLFLDHRSHVQSLTFRTDYHMFWRESTDDAVYDKQGRVLRADAGSDARAIATELDLLLTWQVDRHTLVYLGYSHVFAGSFIEDTGPSRDIDFVYAAFTYTF